ncbi:hypothetical protein TRVL_03281 [Trypanosoma vivax]|nr:hypothetical protein TRVL_03281 [Trypanosoma vivax]
MGITPHVEFLFHVQVHWQHQKTVGKLYSTRGPNVYGRKQRRYFQCHVPQSKQAVSATSLLSSSPLRFMELQHEKLGIVEINRHTSPFHFSALPQMHVQYRRYNRQYVHWEQRVQVQRKR